MLFVEDSPEQRRFTETQLTEAGFQAILREDGQEALSFFTQAILGSTTVPVDVVVTDLDLPTRSGIEWVVTALKIPGNLPPVIFYSTLANSHNFREESANFSEMGLHFSALTKADITHLIDAREANLRQLIIIINSMIHIEGTY